MNDAASSEQPVSSTESGSGAALLAERRRQNLSLGDISRQLKLSVRQVEALERDDFSGYQGPVFVHGFIRNYAKLLALDPVPLIRAADRLLNPAAPVQVEAEPVASRVKDAPRGGKSMWPFVAGTVVVVLVAGYMFKNRGGNDPEEPQVPKSPAGEQLAAVPATNEKRQPAARPADKPGAGRPVVEKPVAEKPVTEKSSAEKPAPEKQVEERGAGEKRVEASAPTSRADLPKPVSPEAMETGPRMSIRMIFDQDSWVEIKDRNGNAVFGQLNAAGTRRSASGEPPLTIVVGNAAGVRLFQGDKSIDLAPHTRVDVARLTIE